MNRNKTDHKSRENKRQHPTDHLKRLAFFHDFDDHELRQLLAVGKWFRISPDDLIIEEGTTERAFYILVRGEADVVKKVGGNKKPVVLTTLKTGACFGEMAVLTASYRTASVMAKTETYVLRIEPEILNTSNVFLQLKFYRRFCETLVTRLDLANQRVAGKVIDEEQALHQAIVMGAQPEPDGGAKSDLEQQGASSGAAISAWHRRKVPPPMPIPNEDRRSTHLLQLINPLALKTINPEIAAEINRLVTTGQVSSESSRFAGLISSDPILSCRILQAANAIPHRRHQAVQSIAQAIIVVGIDESEDVAEKAIDEAKGFTMFSGYRDVADRFWQHGMVVGRIAELLGNALRLQLDFDPYLAGVLHDLGVMALDRLCPEFYPQYAAEQPPFPDQVKSERLHIGLDHGKAALGLKKGFWLPQVYWDIMEGHHRLNKVIANPLPAALIGLADLFAAERGVGLSNSRTSFEAAETSAGWQLLKQYHRPFAEADHISFCNLFRIELDKEWTIISKATPYS